MDASIRFRSRRNSLASILVPLPEKPSQHDYHSRHTCRTCYVSPLLDVGCRLSRWEIIAARKHGLVAVAFEHIVPKKPGVELNESK